MGQRSQIYVRYPKSEGRKGLIAEYFGWNYRERMISRARHGMDYIYETHINKKYSSFTDKDYIKKVTTIFKTNFDMVDTAITCDIVKEWNTQFPTEEFMEMVFYQQDNNNGKLFVDVLDGQIKYCFTDRDAEKPMSAEEYMNWDSDTDDWQEYFRQSEYYDNEDIETCKANIERIEVIATVMTEEELQEFLQYDYVSDFDENELPVHNLLNTDIATSFTVSNICIKDILGNRIKYNLKADWRHGISCTETSVYKLIMGLPICITSYIRGEKRIVPLADEITDIEYWMKNDIAVPINGKEYIFSKLSEAEKEYLLNRRIIVNTVIGSVNDATEEQKENLIKVVNNYY